MTRQLRALLVEDSRDDAVLIVRELRRGGFEVESRRVATREELSSALAEQAWDVVFCDYELPSFSGPEALGLLRASGLDLPIIVVSGYLGEEAAAEVMRAGAGDFVLKDNLPRLVPAVERELSEAASRRERRQVEAALERTEDYNRALLQAIPDLFFRLDRRGTYLDFVPGSIAPLAPTTEFLGKTLDQVLPRDIARLIGARLEEAIATREVTTAEYRLEGEDGPRWYEARIAPSAEEEAIALVRDVTDQKDLERQMRAAQRMEAVGRLAGGIAHDFNNVLTIVQSYAELLRNDAPPGGTFRSDAEVILDAVERANRMTRQLLAFSRRQVQALEVLDLGAIVRDMEEMLRRLLGGDIELVTDLASDAGAVKADPAQVEQVLMNLAVNARDAMPQGGRLHLEVSDGAVDEDIPLRTGRRIPAGRYTILTVTDSGVGMDEETCGQIFEPFFTTKELGSGLGLSTIYGIVKQSRGFIAVESEPGSGTTFRIYLPRAERESPRRSNLQPIVREPDGSETVLLVDDEDVLRRAVRRILERAGYRILEAPGGEEAIRAARDHGGPIHALITDLVMPRMSGEDLAEKLAADHPGLRVIYVSGYASEEVGEGGVLSGGARFLQKPFPPDELLGALRNALAAAE